MVKFCDLPLEILLDITERATEPTATGTTETETDSPSPSPSRHHTTNHSLSLVCRYLNGVTARKLFRTYRLQLREKDRVGRHGGHDSGGRGRQTSRPMPPGFPA